MRRRLEKSTSRWRRGGCRRSRRGGYLYVAVLFTSLIVAGAIGTAISLDTIRIKTESAAAERDTAVRMAESEIHRVSVLLTTDRDWREGNEHGTPSGWVAYGPTMGSDNASARYVLFDEDGDLQDDPFDDVEVVAHSSVGVAEAAVSVCMETGFAPLDLLRFGVTTFDDLRCENGAALVSEKPVQVFNDCKTDSEGMVVAPTVALDGTLELSVRGDLTTSQVGRIEHDVVQRYRDIGSQIDISYLPIVNGSRSIYAAVLSNNANPYGSPDAAGVYWIDAEGQQVTIAHSRLDAVLAIQNASRVVLTGAISWQAPERTGVMLVADAPVEFRDVEPVLDESALAANFNPPGSPYRGVDSNLSAIDRFPTEFYGIVYSGSDILVMPTTDGAPITVTGSLICDDLRLWHTLQVRAFDEILTAVPAGFSDPSQYRFKSGTFRRVPTP